MPEHQVLFCPFCRESFEDSATCPEHELGLVPLERLRASGSAELDDEEEEVAHAPEDRVLAAFDPRFGRAAVALGAILNALALALELVQVRGSRMLRGYELAHALPSLWTLALVSFTALYALARRRTPRGLRSLRVLMPMLALISPVTLALALLRVARGAQLGAAVYVVAVASGLMLLGGFRLGSTRSRGPQ